MEALNKHVDHHVDTVNEILEKFKDYLLAEVGKREELEKQVERLNFSSTGTKGRVGTLAEKNKTLEADLDDLTLRQGNDDREIYTWTARDANREANRDLSTYFEDELDKMRRGFEDMENLQRDVQAQAAAIDELQVIATARVGNGISEPSPEKNVVWLTKSKYDAISGTNESLQKLKNAFQKTVEKRVFHHEFIDQAPTLEALYVMFHQLTKIMDVALDGCTYCEGPFEATSEQAFFLRDRVLCRIALFNSCAKALRDAQAAEVEL